MKKRVLSILIALCMVLCLVPTSVFAEDEAIKPVATAQELAAALADSSVGTVQLAANIDISSALEVNRAVVLDLNGCTLKMTGNDSVIIVNNGGSMLVKGSASGGSITGGKGRLLSNDPNERFGGGVYIGEGGAFTLEGGTISGCEANKNGGGVYIGEGGTFTMTNGNITGCTDSGNGGGIYIYRYGTMNANGGTVDDQIYNMSDGVVKSSGPNQTVFSGTATNEGTISGGKFESNVNNENSGTIRGGTFSGTVNNEGTIEDSAKATVAFDAQGGSSVPEQKILRGQKAAKPAAPEKEGYIFMG